MAFASLRVLDLTQGPLLVAGNMLAKLGADVIAVEPPARVAARRTAPATWSAFASGKRGVTCDLQSEGGRTLFARLASTADIVITGDDLSGDALPLLDWDRLLADNPRLILVSVTPFGEDGPKSGYAATDLIIWAAGGPLHPSRDGERPPLRISSDQALLHAGSDAALGALIALAARERTGRGQKVTVSAQQSAAQATLSIVLAAPVGHEGYTIMAPTQKAKPGEKRVLDLSGSGVRTRRSKWTVKDGFVELHLAMGPAGGRFTNNLFAWLHSIGACQDRFLAWNWAETVPAQIESGEISDDDMEEARADVAAALAGFTKCELLEVSIRHKLLLAPIMTVADLAESDHLEARGVFVDVAEGSDRRRVPFALTGRLPESPAAGAPALGEHNAAVYGELGLGPDDLAALVSEDVI